MSDSENQSAPNAAAARRFDLSGRVVVVTGASKGIGRELTILLAETGAVVVPTVRTDADAAAVASEAEARGLTVHPQRLDVRDVASINEAVSGHRRRPRPYRCPRQQRRPWLRPRRLRRDRGRLGRDDGGEPARRILHDPGGRARNGGVGAGRPHCQHQLAGRTRGSSGRVGVLRQQGRPEHDDQDAGARMGEECDHGQRHRADLHLYAGDGADPR